MDGLIAVKKTHTGPFMTSLSRLEIGPLFRFRFGLAAISVTDTGSGALFY